ncbi:MAG: TonB-dependent receptor [Lautropia sp.]|nr:TonB-dependent receptor [Lautropia sp.]
MTSLPLPPFARACCALAVASVCVPVFAFEPEALEAVVVVGAREPQLLSQATGDVVLIDRAMLENSGHSSVDEVLRRHAGLQLARNGGPGQGAGYFLRGVGSSGVVVLLDGMRVGSATLGQFDFGSLSIDQIERIEVLRGPASGLYGADAVGGVINIITRHGEGDPGLSGRLALGNYGSREMTVGLRGAQGAFDYALGLSHEKSKGVSAVRAAADQVQYNPDADGFKRKTAQVRLGYAPAAGHRIGLVASRGRLNAQYDGADYLPPDFTPDPGADFRNHLDTEMRGLEYRGRMNEQWMTTLRYANSVDDANSGGRTMSRYKTDRDQLSWQNTVQLSAGEQLVLAYEKQDETVSAERLGVVPKRTNKALLAGYTGHFGATVLAGSVRRDDNSAYGKKTTGSIGFNHTMSSVWKLRTIYGTSFRAPTFNDLYYPGYGVAALKPEEGRSLELGLNWQEQGSRAGFGFYRTKLRNMIAYDADSSGTICPSGYFGCAANTERAKLQGFTVDLAAQSGAWQWQAVYDWLKATNEQTGERLPRRAKHQASLSADYVMDGWRLGASVLYVGKRPDQERLLKAYTTVDLKAAWRMSGTWQWEAKLLNATDRQIEPVYGYQDLGRQIWVGVRADMGGLK